MSKHHKKNKSYQPTQYQREKTQKSLTIFERIEANKQAITTALQNGGFGPINNVYWLRRQIAETETNILYPKTGKEKQESFDNPCIRGIEMAYDYILENPKEEIKVTSITNIHYLLCNQYNIVQTANSFIHAGRIRQTNYSPMGITEQLRDIAANLYTNKDRVLLNAFDFHYQMILLQPFDDYNKRTARMVMNWFLFQNGYRPIAFTRKSDRINYPDALLKMKNHNTDEYYEYMLDALLASQEKLLKQLNTSKIK